jgi:N-acetyl-gamma-glutamyl-phosphate reductase
MDKYPHTMNNQPIAAAVLGASGYTGLELVRLLGRHPVLSLRWATSESGAGEPVPGTALRYVPASAVPLGEAGLVFVCLPHGEAGAWALRAREAGAAVVDLSADLRMDRSSAVYGVPELWREEIRGAALVANPGCYPTGILLGLAPLLRADLLDGERAVIIDAASGVTGAGRSPKRELLYGEVAEDYRAYSVGNVHRHVAEIGAGLARLAGAQAPDFVFTPHLLPVRRGILETIYLPVKAGVDVETVRRAVRSAYEEEPFLEVLDEGLPSLRDVTGSNRVALGFAAVAGVKAPLVLCVVAFDNLVKGAAGQAVQNANLMLDRAETEGLTS